MLKYTEKRSQEVQLPGSKSRGIEQRKILTYNAVATETSDKLKR